MKGKNTGSYRNKNGNVVFRYEVQGSEAELAKYEEIQGENYRKTDDGKPLFFTTRFAGNSVDLIITRAGKVVADMSAFDAAASMATQYGGNLGQELARQAAAQLFGGASKSTVENSTPVTSNVAESADPADLDK
jgi:hypothetical protein